MMSTRVFDTTFITPGFDRISLVRPPAFFTLGLPISQ